MKNSTNRIQLCTMGLGAGADPDMGKKSAEEVAGEIEDYLEGSHLVFNCRNGGGTGTGASPVMARIIKVDYINSRCCDQTFRDGG